MFHQNDNLKKIKINREFYEKIKDNLKTDIEIIYVWSHIAKTIILIIINYKKIFIYF